MNEKVLDYEQELYRNGFANSLVSFAFCFTAVAVVTSISSLYPTAMANGGPAVIFWSWIVACVLTMISGLSLAEISSTYVNAGSVYFYAGKMAPAGWGPFLAYITGWFNLVGNIASDSFLATAFAEFVGIAMVLAGKEPLSINFKVLLGTLAIFSWALLNLLRVDHQSNLHVLAAFWQVCCTLIILVILVTTCSQDRFTFTEVLTVTYNGTGFSSMPYVVLIGTLSALYTFTGYESAGHMAEETVNASTSVPWGIVYTCGATSITGLVYWLTLLLASKDLEGIVESDLGVTYIFRISTNQKIVWG
jgi:amino acid transporter